VTISTRSRLLLLWSTLAPITVVALRLTSLQDRRVIRVRAEALLPFDPGLLPDLVFMLGVLCFIGFLISILTDYFHARRRRWL
jgi:hypothetical protein